MCSSASLLNRVERASGGRTVCLKTQQKIERSTFKTFKKNIFNFSFKSFHYWPKSEQIAAANTHNTKKREIKIPLKQEEEKQEEINKKFMQIHKIKHHVIENI